jgi:hypothetical protein
MTSEPDSTPRRRPPTIDLTAKEVETAPGGSAQDSAAPDSATAGATRAARNPGGAIPYVIGAVVGAVVVAAIVVGIWIGGFVPVREAPRGAAVTSAPTANAAGSTDEISSRLEKIQDALKTPRTDEALVSRIAAAEAQTKALGDQLSALARRVDDIAATSQTALAEAKAATSVADGAKNAAQAAAQHADLDALAQRVAALENAIKSLGSELTQRTSRADDRATRVTVAAEALRATVERGAPYQAELAAVKSLGVEDTTLAPLTPFAADGVPSAAALAREFATLMPSLSQAPTTPTRDTSYLGRLEAYAQNFVRITPAADAPPGDDASAVVARINDDVTRGDFANALAAIASLPGGARSAAQSWVKKVEAREAALTASRRIAGDALAALGRPVSQ